MEANGFIQTTPNRPIKKPYITGGLIIVGTILTLAGIVLEFIPFHISLGVLPYITLILGIALLFVCSGYFLGRRTSVKMAKKQEEVAFKQWVKTTYNLRLDSDQTDQLLNYGSTVINGKTFFIQRDYLENGDVIVYLQSETNYREALETGTIEQIPQAEPLKPQPNQSV